ARTAEHAFEDHTRIDFHGERSGWIFPGDRVHVGTAVGRVTAADPSGEILCCQFERWEWRILANLVCDELIDRRAGAHIFCNSSEWNRTAQPCGNTDGVAVQRIAQFGNECDPISKGFQWLEDRGELEVSTCFRRCPVAGPFPERHKDHCKTHQRTCCGFCYRRQCRNHCFQKRQRNGCTHTAQHRAA